MAETNESGLRAVDLFDSEQATQVAAFEADETPERVAQVLRLRNILKDLVKVFDADLDKSLFEWLQANGELEVGEIRYYVGNEKKTKCKDRQATLEALLESTDGDVSGLTDALVKEPFKQGSVRGIVGHNRHAELFETEKVEDTKTGKPKKSVKSIDRQTAERLKRGG